MNHGDSLPENCTVESLIKAYRDGEISMEDAALVVHYGTITEDGMEEQIEAQGGWDVVVDRILPAWAEVCIGEGYILTGSL